MLLLTVVPSVSEDEVATEVKVTDSKVYIIQKGDTLWDISGREYSDNFQWPTIWKQNSYITNPDLIYPGNELIIPGKTGITVEGFTTGDFFDDKPYTPIYTEYTYDYDYDVDFTPTRTIIDYTDVCPADAVLAAGYIKYENEFVESGYVLGDVKYREKQMNAEGEEVVLSFSRNTPGVSLGSSFLIYRWGNKINDLDGTKNYLGRLVEIVGVVMVTEIGDVSSKGTIIKSYGPTLKGDLLRPYSSVSSVTAFNNSGPTERIGYIVASLHNVILPTHSQSIVYIDCGSRHGVSIGNVFDVYRLIERISEPKSRDKKKERYVYKEHIGKVFVINVEHETATCAVLQGKDVIEIGNYIRFTTEY